MRHSSALRCSRARRRLTSHAACASTHRACVARAIRSTRASEQRPAKCSSPQAPRRDDDDGKAADDRLTATPSPCSGPRGGIEPGPPFSPLRKICVTFVRAPPAAGCIDGGGGDSKAKSSSTRSPWWGRGGAALTTGALVLFTLAWSTPPPRPPGAAPVWLRRASFGSRGACGGLWSRWCRYRQP